MKNKMFNGFKVITKEPIRAGNHVVIPTYLIGRNKHGEWEQATIHDTENGDYLTLDNPELRKFIDDVKPVDQNLVRG